MTDTEIRPARREDAGAIARIYNHYIEHSTATFDIEPKSARDREEWLADRDEGHPVVVAVRDGRVVGWASLSEFRLRAAYRHTVEVGVYVEPGHTGQGLGPALLGRVLADARSAGHHVVVSQIVAGNEASIKLARSAGFETVGTMREVGRKFDRWLDVVIMELRL